VTFRLFAALASLAGAATLLAALALIGEAPGVPAAGRHLRAMKARREAPREVTPIGIADVEALPHDRPLAQYAALERRGVSIEGWVQRTILAGDGDMHLELATTPRRSGGPDTAYVTAEITPQWRTGRWSYEALAAVFRPNDGTATPWEGGPERVRVSGWLLYDFQYDHAPTNWTKERGAPRVSGWEVHPVTRLERWSDARAAWVEVPR